MAYIQTTKYAFCWFYVVGDDWLIDECRTALKFVWVFIQGLDMGDRKYNINNPIIKQAGMSSAQPQAEAGSLKFWLVFVCIYNSQFSDWSLLLKLKI